MPSPINVSGFSGASLAASPRLLPDGVGVAMTDAVPGTGDLRPLRAPLTVASVDSSAQTIYRMGRDAASDAAYWLAWPAVVNVARGFDGTDPTERTYFTGSGTPKWTDNVIGLGSAPYPQATRELSVPAPVTAPALTLSSDGTRTESTRFYVYTYVNEIGWESAPSPLSAGLTCKDGATVAIGGLSAPPAGNYGINRIRIYRTQSGSSGSANYYFLREISSGSTSSTDDARSLGDAIATIGWLPPASDAHSLIALWGGMMALLTGKTVCFCEPNTHYAWPVKYDWALNDTGVMLAKWGQNLLVLTTANPVVMQGTDPSSMSDTGISIPAWPCLSKRGVVSFEGGVVWPSADGLAYVGDRGHALLTLPHLTADQWRAMKPDTMIAASWGRFYVCSYDDGSGRKGFMIDPSAPTGFYSLSFGWTACFTDPVSGQLYVHQAGSVKKFDAGAFLTATFKSKVFTQTSPASFRFGKVVADAYPVTVKVWADQIDKITRAKSMVLRMTRTVNDAGAFALPARFMSEDWQAEVSTSAGRAVALRLAAESAHLKGA